MMSSASEETRTRILDAARRLLEDGGTASMGDIAEAAGVTRQLLYVRFEGGRSELLLELSRRIDAEVRTPERQARVDDAPDACSALREAVALQGHIKPRIHGVASAIDHLRRTDPDAAEAWSEREASRLERCREVIERLHGEGVLDPCWAPADAARLMWSATSQRAWTELVHEGSWSTQRWARHTTSLLERALLVATD